MDDIADGMQARRTAGCCCCWTDDDGSVNADPGVYEMGGLPASRARNGSERGERKREMRARGIYSCWDTETRNYVAAGLGARR